MQKWNYNILIPAFLLILAGNCLGQPSGKIVLLGLSVDGNKRANAGLIVATSSLVVGEELTGEKIQRAIRQLWELELFSDVRIIAEQVSQEGAYLLIRVKEYPRLEVIDIDGGKKIGKDEIEEAIDLFPGQSLKPSTPIRLRRKIEQLCEEEGYLLADITVEIREGSKEDYDILFVRVAEGKKVKIKKIEFDGNNAFKVKKLRKLLKNTKKKSLFRSGEFHIEKYDEDLKNLIEFYQENGYRDAHVLGDSIWYTDDKRRMFLTIKLEEGNRYYFGDVTFSGSDLFSEAELQRQLMFQPGDVFNQKKYDITIRERLTTLFYDQGYIYTQVLPTEIPAGGDTLDIQIHINPGNQFSVRRIHITGNTKTREKVIRREFDLKPGDTFDVSKLRRSMRDVTILNYFSNIVPDVEDISDSEVDLWVKVEEKPTDQANLSAGYSERDGVIGAIGFTAPNFFGSGQILNLDWNFGYQYGSFSISYTEPWLFDTETLVGVSFYDVSRRWVDGFSEDLIGGSLRIGRRFRWPDDYFRGDWIYRLERSKYSNFSESFKLRNEQGISEDETRISSAITQIITRDSRDYPEFPTTGSVTTLTTELAGGFLRGNDRYHKHIFSAEWYTPVYRKVVLYNNLLFGYLDGLSSNPQDMPLLEYFYMGGSGLSLGTPLRGYEERTVGPPSVSGGSALGGKSQLKVGAELRVQMVDNPTIYGLAFAEAGNTWRNFDQTDPFNLKRSIGLGVRLYMPLIGLIGLDYGYGLDYYINGRREGSWKPHFQFGRQF